MTRLDRSAFSLSTGLRGAGFVAIPIVVGAVTGHLEYLFAALGAFFLTQTEGPHSNVPGWILLVACGTESAAFGVGTLVATTNFLLPVWLAIALSIILLGRRNTRWLTVAPFTAITFTVGIGLPGASIPVALERTYLGLIGGVLALSGAELQRWLTSRKHSTEPRVSPPPTPQMSWSQTAQSAVAIGVASAFGLALGLQFGLPRDFWVVLTIIFAVRPTFGLTLNDTVDRVGGTAIGAAIAAAIVLEASSLYVLVPLLVGFLVLAISSRGVNVGLVMIFVVPYVVILLNIVYPSQWEYALYRIVDVAIGGALALVTVAVLEALHRISRRLKREGSWKGLSPQPGAAGNPVSR